MALRPTKVKISSSDLPWLAVPGNGYGGRKLPAGGEFCVLPEKGSMGKIQNLGIAFTVVGGVLFVLRGVVSTINPQESYARDIFGFPLLGFNQNVPLSVWIQFIIGASLPFIFIGLGLLIQRIAKPKSKTLRQFLNESRISEKDN